MLLSLARKKGAKDKPTELHTVNAQGECVEGKTLAF